MVNHIKTSALNSRLRKVNCDDIGSEYLSLLFHTDVRWISPRNTVLRFFVLRKELLQFFRTTDHEYQKILVRYFWSYESLQSLSSGPESNIIDFKAKLTAFIRKLNLWIKNIENRQFGMFQNVASLGGKPSITFHQTSSTVER